MSRNLGRTSCRFCGGAVTLLERPRAITRGDCGIYYDEHEGHSYQGAIVASAECVDCLAKYLAWVDLTKCVGYGRHPYFAPSKDGAFFDLSFRSTFNDEPGEDDLPLHEIKVVRLRKPWPTCAGCGKRIYLGYGCQCDPVTRLTAHARKPRAVRSARERKVEE